MSIKSRLYYKIVYNINKINDGLCNNIYDRRILNRLKICLQWEFKTNQKKLVAYQNSRLMLIKDTGMEKTS